MVRTKCSGADAADLQIAIKGAWTVDDHNRCCDTHQLMQFKKPDKQSGFTLQDAVKADSTVTTALIKMSPSAPPYKPEVVKCVKALNEDLGRKFKDPNINMHDWADAQAEDPRAKLTNLHPHGFLEIWRGKTRRGRRRKDEEQEERERREGRGDGRGQPDKDN